MINGAGFNSMIWLKQWLCWKVFENQINAASCLTGVSLAHHLMSAVHSWLRVLFSDEHKQLFEPCHSVKVQVSAALRYRKLWLVTQRSFVSADCTGVAAKSHLRMKTFTKFLSCQVFFLRYMSHANYRIIWRAF